MRDFQNENVFLLFSSLGHKSITFFYYPAVSFNRIQLKWKAQSNTHTQTHTRVKSLKLKQFVWGFGFGFGFAFGFWLLVLSLRSIITANMSTEIIAQIDSAATTFCRSKSNSNVCHFRFKCPAMCCSQTAELRTPCPLSKLYQAGLGGGRVLCALPEIITQLGFLWGLQQTLLWPHIHPLTHTHAHTHSDTLTFNLYYLCWLLSGIYFALSPPFVAAHFVYLSAGRLY